MVAPPVPRDEQSRLAALGESRLLDSPAEEGFDDIVRMAAQICGTPMSAVTLIASDRQWFKAKVGLTLTETRREDSFCAHGLEGEQPLIVHDAWSDARFADNPLVMGAPSIRFYAGVPLHIDESSALGSLCVFDTVPRTLDPAQLGTLKMLARHVSREMRLRRERKAKTARAVPPGLPVAPGDLVGNGLRLTRPIGRGGVGAVFEAAGPGGERVAVKFLLPQWLSSPDLVERFAREAGILSSLRSPHVNRVLTVGNLDEERLELPYLVLEYLEGVDLEQVLEERGCVPWREAAAWVIDVCSGLTEAHALGVVHRDLKPSNVFLARGPEGAPTVKLLDFGIAKIELSPSRAPITAINAVMGSIHYMSPEQMTAARSADARSDVWSLGVLLHRLVSGRLPFEGENDIEVCVAVMRRPPLPLRAHLPDVPPAFEAVVRRCLQRERGARFGAALELADALRASLAADLEGDARGAGPP